MMQYEQEIEERREAERQFLGDDFEQLEAQSNEELLSDEFPEEFFYLWDTNAESFSVFRTLRPYLKEDKLDTTLILALAKEKCLKLEKLLLDLPLILHGYLSVLHPAQPDNRTTDFEERETVDTQF
jgi:hypothetical protein